MRQLYGRGLKMGLIKQKFVLFCRKVLFFRVLPLVFNLFKHRPLDEKLVLFAYNRNYSSMPDNMQGIFEYLKNKGFNCVEMASPKSGLKRLFFNLRFQKCYAVCRCVFLTDNFDPVYAHEPREGTRVIQLWHACGAFKKWGYSTADLAWGADKKSLSTFPMHNTYTDVFVSARAVVPCYAEAFGCDEKIIRPFGVPRTDVFFDEAFVERQRSELQKLFPEIGNRKIILYAPTFRGNDPETAHNEIRLDLEKLREKLSKEYVLLIKLHPFTAEKFEFSEDEKERFGNFVFNASKRVNIDTALCSADLLIADYSSLIFEYALLERPMLFFAYDLEEYDRERSFYYEYKSFVPGKTVTDADGIIKAIETGDFEKEKVAPFRERFMSACDGNCTRRIAEYAVSR